MSDCACLRDFPPRNFKTASDADDFMSRVRVSPAFRYVGMDGVETQREKYRCRACGADWACTIPAQPPYVWAPAIMRPAAVPEQPAVVPPQRPATRPLAVPFATPAPKPAATPVPPPQPNTPFLEVGPRRTPSENFTLICEDEDTFSSADVLAALTEWRPGLFTWKANAGLKDVEIEIGHAIPKNQSIFELFAKTWRPELINQGWRGLKSTKGLRPVHLRGIRALGEGSSGFLGEYYLVVIDLKARKVVAWMMAEAK